MTDEAGKARTYGGRAYVKKEDPARCVEAVWNNTGWYHHQCPNKRGKGPGGLYCGTHDPERIAAKNAERAAKYKAKMDQHPLAIARRENEKLRAALQKARHALAAVGGLYATDIHPENRAALIAKGAKIEWRIDTGPIIATIDSAMDGGRG